jgi:hypothetical protein
MSFQAFKAIQPALFAYIFFTEQPCEVLWVLKPWLIGNFTHSQVLD